MRNRRVTRGLTGVTNGSPKFGRSKAVVRLIQGTQRYMLVMPLARVNSHVLPPVVERRVALNGTMTVALAPAGRTPPSGTVIVWPLRVAFTARPSTVTLPSASRPSGPMTVLSRRRSMPAPESLRAVIVTRATQRSGRRPPGGRRRHRWPRSRMELRLTEPGAMADMASSAPVPPSATSWPATNAACGLIAETGAGASATTRATTRADNARRAKAPRACGASMPGIVPPGR